MAQGQVIKQFLIGLGVDPDNEALERFDRGLDKVRDGLQGLVSLGAKAAGVVAGIGGALSAQAAATAKHADQTLESARALGLSVEEYQRLTLAAARYRIEQEDVNDILSVLSDRADDAIRGTTSFVEAFELLNIQPKELEGLEPEEIFYRVSDAISQTEDDTRRLTAAERLLGGDMQRRFMPLMRRGADDIKSMGDEFDSLGAVMSEDSLKSARRLRHQWTRLTVLADGLRHRLGTALSPALVEIIERFTDWLGANQKLVRTKIDQFADELVGKVRTLADTTADLAKRADQVADSLGGWDAVLLGGAAAGGSVPLLSVADKIVSIVRGLWDMRKVLPVVIGALSNFSGQLSIISSVGWGSWFSGVASSAASAASTFGIVAAVVSALAVAIEDVLAYGSGKRSLTGMFFSWFQQLDSGAGLIDESAGLLRDLQYAIGRLIDLWPYLESAGLAAIQSLMHWWGWMFTSMTALSVPFFNLFVAGFRTAFDLVAALVYLFTGQWGKAWKKIKGIAVLQGKAIYNFFMGLFEGLEQTFSGFISNLVGDSKRLANLFGYDLGADTSAQVNQTVRVRGGATVGGAQRQSERLGPTREAAARIDQQNTFNITTQPGQSEEQIADIAQRKIDESNQEAARKMRDELSKGSEL